MKKYNGFKFKLQASSLNFRKKILGRLKEVVKPYSSILDYSFCFLRPVAPQPVGRLERGAPNAILVIRVIVGVL